MFFASYTNVVQAVTSFLTQVHLFSSTMQSSSNSSSDDFLGALLNSIEKVFPFVYIYWFM